MVEGSWYTGKLVYFGGELSKIGHDSGRVLFGIVCRRVEYAAEDDHQLKSEAVRVLMMVERVLLRRK